MRTSTSSRYEVTLRLQLGAHSFLPFHDFSYMVFSEEEVFNEVLLGRGGVL